MREYTRTFTSVVGVGAITVDPDLANRPNSSPSTENVSVCARCSGKTFRPVTWAHLRGDTLDQPVPDVDGDTSDYHIMDDLDFVVKMFNTGENPKKRGPMVDFKIPANEILKSSQESCGFCKLLVKLDRHGTLPAEHDKTRVLRLQAFWPEKVNGSMHPMMLEIGLHPDISGGGGIWSLTFFNEQAVLDWSESADGLAVHEARTPLLQQAATWIWSCERTHDKCSHSANHRPPTRLLDLIHLWKQERVHLVESADVVNGQYAVSSYVWGTSSTLRLDKATQSKFKGGIAFDELPQTIREAVLVTDALRIRHLWIDSLCILQDSDTDKSYEIPRMNDYYRNAFVVISASGAKDVHSGFTFYQETSHDVYTKLQHPDHQRQSLTGPVPLRIPGHFPGYSTSLLVDTMPMLYNYNREPINKRAWTLQESVLPRRLLTFPMTGGLSMNCLEGEVLAGEIVSDPYHEVPSSNSLGIVSSKKHTGDELLELWTVMVEDYTRRSLSHRSDILVAIGALVREFHTKHGTLLGKYLGGLWENHVRSSLL
ncbi:hypothetical protein LTR70_009326 [Exophiala xenobiotica]|uniref:Heterokaryon incompatibility domain-containing protein n=1 Tax=Lithohypha guttulata TaxID=1690604 RepID=A0ABR0K116_9EURO|nr:hypothetical protein LTR24_008336 [Lithohypha guttulata]KAK5310641.1 hypothetical protein LTR70_009326 [Exophiala xenobiotica]